MLPDDVRSSPVLDRKFNIFTYNSCFFGVAFFHFVRKSLVLSQLCAQYVGAGGSVKKSGDHVRQKSVQTRTSNRGRCKERSAAHC